MDDKRLEAMIGNLLRAGVLLAAATVFIGGSLYLAHDHARVVDYQHFSPSAVEQHTIAGIVKSALRGESGGLMQFGLLLLIATPIARVAMAVVGFALERDKLYATVSLIVLLILAFSFMHIV
jgi:uncharacterized membrane protein